MSERRERLVVAHYFNPGHLISVVEVVLGPETSPETVETTTRLLREAGKTPAVLRKEVPGFIANRLQAALLREALALIEDGVCSMEDLDVWHAITTNLYPEISDAKHPQALLAVRATQGHLGLKSGRGFYEWPPTDAAAALAGQDGELLRHLHRANEETVD